jgi:protocatechuate 3,4-dioxygenase beta subunit
MKAKASYPNPFAGATLTTCALSCEMTQGPCWDSHAEVIQDISYGYTGLPMRMYLRVVDDACNPVANAIVEVWHVSAVGKYSGDDATNEDVSFCTGNDATFTSALYFRGKQTTDSNGVVFFDTCFPGWYSSRTIHVHFSVTIGGTNYVTAQLFFADSLDDEIVDTQPIYKDRGARDTTNATDMVISSSTVGDYEFQTSQMTDGAMLAWKTLIVRKSQSESSCSIGGSGGGGPGGDGGGPGMPPGAG